MDRSTSTGARLNWRIHGCLAGWRTWPARVDPPDASQSLYDAVAHSSSVIAGLALDQNHETDRQRRPKGTGPGGAVPRDLSPAPFRPRARTPYPHPPAGGLTIAIHTVRRGRAPPAP